MPGIEPDEVITRVLDVNGYEGHITHVEDCRSLPVPARQTLEGVHCFQRISVPGVAKVQQKLVLVDAGTIKGYRLAYWYLLRPETEALDPKAAPPASSTSGRGWRCRGWWVTP